MSTIQFLNADLTPVSNPYYSIDQTYPHEYYPPPSNFGVNLDKQIIKILSNELKQNPELLA